MGERDSQVPSRRADRPGTVPTTNADTDDGLTEVHELFRKTNFLLGIGFLFFLLALGVVLLVANSGRLAAEGTRESIRIQFVTAARTACVTDLRTVESIAVGEAQAATLRTLAITYGVDPDTLKPIPKEARDARALVEIRKGLAALQQRAEASNSLRQPNLDKACGPPITNVDRATKGGN